jgi:signal transduction histidine kinase/CheY-like chemotaxis protein
MGAAVTGPSTRILVQSASALGSLQTTANELPWATLRGVTYEALGGDVQHAVAECRARIGPAPLAAVVDNEPAVLAALVGGADEAVVLHSFDACALGALLDRTETRARMRAEGQRLHDAFAHAEKLTALGTLVAGIGHEINNPLTAMVLSIDAARRYVVPALDAAWEVARATRNGAPLPTPALEKLSELSAAQERMGRDTGRLLDDLGGAADSIASIVRDLRVFARTDHEEPLELCSVDEVIEQALRLVSRELFQHALLERDYAPDLPKLVVPRNRVTQVMINVLINAAHAIREIARPAHRIRISARADEEFVAIAISDTGPGIAPDALDHIFDPFYTTKRQELGTGLGLPISRSILQRLGGDLSVESVYGEGATFLCFLPIPTREQARAAFARTRMVVGRSAAAQPQGSVLVVDDDERLLRSYVRMLNPLHRVLIAQDGRDAIELLESGSTPDVVVLELDLPGVDGRELLDWMAEHRPTLHRHTLLVTSTSADSRHEAFLRGYAGPVLHKPVRGEELLEAIARVRQLASPA